MLVVSMMIVALKVDIKLSEEIKAMPNREKLRRIDWLGSFTLVLTVGSLLLGLSLKTTEDIPWSHPLVWGLLVFSAFFLVLFVCVEAKWSLAPVMPLRLLKQRTPMAVAMSNLSVWIVFEAQGADTNNTIVSSASFRLLWSVDFFCIRAARELT